jgi:hypothetical protein
MENILLDIKMNQEQIPSNFPVHIPPNINFHDISTIPIVARASTPQPSQQEESVLESLDKPMVIDPVTEELYTSVLNEAHQEASKDEELETSPKMTLNYESMTKEELLEIAKKRGLRVGNKPGREKLVQLIRKSENVIDGSSSFEPLQEAVSVDA